MDVVAVVRPLEMIEAGMQAYYEALATRFGEEDPDASKVFSRLAFEEKSHLNKLTYLRRLLRQLTHSLNPVEADRRALDEEIALLNEAVQRVSVMSLTEAIDLALKIEFGAGEVHGRLAIAEANPELRVVLVGLKEGDEQHAKRLITLVLNRGGLP